MMEKEEKKLFEEYKLELIRLDADIICTSPAADLVSPDSPSGPGSGGDPGDEWDKNQ